MKKILFLILFLPLLSFGQTTTVLIKAGNSTYWTLNGQDYPRAQGFFTFGYFPHAHDTAFSIASMIYDRLESSQIPATRDTFFYYVDSSKFARNAPALQAWFRANAY